VIDGDRAGAEPIGEAAGQVRLQAKEAIEARRGRLLARQVVAKGIDAEVAGPDGIRQAVGGLLHVGPGVDQGEGRIGGYNGGRQQQAEDRRAKTEPGHPELFPVSVYPCA